MGAGIGRPVAPFYTSIASPAARGKRPRCIRPAVSDPDSGDSECLADFAFLLRERKGPGRAVEDRHVKGLFARERWLALLTGVGFEARGVPLALSGAEPGRHEMFVGRRPR